METVSNNVIKVIDLSLGYKVKSDKIGKIRKDLLLKVKNIRRIFDIVLPPLDTLYDTNIAPLHIIKEGNNICITDTRFMISMPIQIDVDDFDLHIPIRLSGKRLKVVKFDGFAISYGVLYDESKSLVVASYPGFGIIPKTYKQVLNKKFTSISRIKDERMLEDPSVDKLDIFEDYTKEELIESQVPDINRMFYMQSLKYRADSKTLRYIDILRQNRKYLREIFTNDMAIFTYIDQKKRL